MDKMYTVWGMTEDGQHVWELTHIYEDELGGMDPEDVAKNFMETINWRYMNKEIYAIQLMEHIA